ncbi:MAG: alpha/beta fold hydrolase [Halobacteriales archaeon]
MPLLVVYAIFNRPWILDLGPDRSVVETFVASGRPTFVLDWGRPTALDGHLGLADYVGRYLREAVDAVARSTGHEVVDLLGYSTGGTLAACLAGARPGRVRSLALVASPIGFDVDDHRLADLRDGAVPDGLVRRGRMAPGPLVAGALASVDPVHFLLGRYLELAAAPTPTRLARLAWSADPVDVPGTLQADLLELARDDALIGGEATLGGDRVDLERLEAPVATAVGARDRLVPAASTEAVHHAAGGPGHRFVAPTDHLGLVSEPVAFETLWPQFASWYDRLGAA